MIFMRQNELVMRRFCYLLRPFSCFMRHFYVSMRQFHRTVTICSASTSAIGKMTKAKINELIKNGRGMMPSDLVTKEEAACLAKWLSDKNRVKVVPIGAIFLFFSV
jgi:hypothetical protein